MLTIIACLVCFATGLYLGLHPEVMTKFAERFVRK